MMGMCDMDKTALEIQNAAIGAGIDASKVNVVKEHVDKASSAPSSPVEDHLNQYASVEQYRTKRLCDLEETSSETRNDPLKMDPSELDVMKDYVDNDSSSSSLYGDPFNQYDSVSDDSEEKPRRKKFTMANHITIIEDSSPICYCCTVCKSFFSHKHTARNHEFCGSGERPFKCRRCEKRFVKRSDRENHYRTHTGERSFVCSVCDKSFYLKHKLNRHMRSHTGIKGDFSCSACSRSFICREALRKHEVNKHNPNKSIQCENCGKRFEKTEERQKHKCASPAKKKKLVCEVCGKTFSKNWNLTVHLRIHVGQRPFKCSICNKSFRLRQHLERHSTKHQTDADFECMLCKQTFGRKDNMIRHLKLNHPDRHLGVDIKDIVQRSEKAKIAKLKKLSEERAIDSEASTEKSLTVVPVDNLPNIRFAKMPSECSKAVAAPIEPQERKIKPVDTSIPKNSSIPSLPGPSAQKSFETRIERSVILQTVMNSDTSSVLRRVETLRYVQSTVVERVDPFKSSKFKSPATEHSEPQPSVLVFNTSRATSSVAGLVESCARSSSPTVPGLSLDRRDNFGDGIREETVPIRPQQVSVLRFSSRDSNKPCQR